MSILHTCQSPFPICRVPISIKSQKISQHCRVFVEQIFREHALRDHKASSIPRVSVCAIEHLTATCESLNNA